MKHFFVYQFLISVLFSLSSVARGGKVGKGTSATLAPSSIVPSIPTSTFPSTRPTVPNAPSLSSAPSMLPTTSYEPSISSMPSDLPSLLPSHAPSLIPSCSEANSKNTKGENKKLKKGAKNTKKSKKNRNRATEESNRSKGKMVAHTQCK